MCVCACVHVCMCVCVCTCLHLYMQRELHMYMAAPLPLLLQVTPTAALQSTERKTPLIEGEDTDEEDTLQPTQVDLSATVVRTMRGGCVCVRACVYIRACMCTAFGIKHIPWYAAVAAMQLTQPSPLSLLALHRSKMRPRSLPVQWAMRKTLAYLL